MMPLAEGAGRRLLAASSSGRAKMLPKEVRCGYSDIMCRVTRGTNGHWPMYSMGIGLDCLSMMHDESMMSSL